MVKDVSVKAATPNQVIEWAQLINAIPKSTNPLYDPDGSFAEQGDVGKIHYLAGTMGGDVDREFNVDLGDTLVLPLINSWEWVLGDYDNLKQAARGWFDFLNPQDAYLKIDLNNDSPSDFEFNLDFDLKDSTYFPDLHIGKEASKFYTESMKDFVFYNPNDSINNGLENKGGFYDAYSTGYYAQIENLPKGMHEIKFGGSFLIEAEGEDPLPIQVSVTDTITVVDTGCDYLL